MSNFTFCKQFLFNYSSHQNFLTIKPWIITDESSAGEVETCDPPSQSSKWCDPSIYGVDHSMCIYPDCPQPTCGEVMSRGITDQVAPNANFSKITNSFII